MPRVRYEGEAVTFGALGRICPQGQGTMTYLDGPYAGCRYEGDFLGGDGNGFFHGQGKWYRPDNTLEYEGEWQQGNYHGSGRLAYFDDEFVGCRYEGEFVKGAPHGQGKWYRPDCTLEYEGDFVGGEYHGQGKCYRLDGTLEYDGELSKGLYHGRGMFVCAEDSEDPGCRYEGEFSEGDFHGQGKWYRRNGTLEYDGELSKGLYHGRGRSYHPDGTTIEYEGEFSEFAFDGQGTLYNPDGSIQRQGRWAAGEPEDSTPSSAGDDSSETGS